jgi:hypothetical protein
MDCQILVGLHKRSIETNLKQIQRRRPCIQNNKILTTHKEKKTHKILHTKVWQEKVNLL